MNLFILKVTLEKIGDRLQLIFFFANLRCWFELMGCIDGHIAHSKLLIFQAHPSGLEKIISQNALVNSWFQSVEITKLAFFQNFVNFALNYVSKIWTKSGF